MRETFFLCPLGLFLLGLVPLLICRRKGAKVMKEEKTLIFVVDDKTRITNAGKDMPFTGLKKGMRVSIKYKKHGDKRIAVRIKILAKMPKKSEGKPAEVLKKY